MLAVSFVQPFCSLLTTYLCGGEAGEECEQSGNEDRRAARVPACGGTGK